MFESGSLISVQYEDSYLSMHRVSLLIEIKPTKDLNKVSCYLSHPKQPFHRIQMNQNGQITCSNQQNKDCIFILDRLNKQEPEGGECSIHQYRIYHGVYKNKKNNENFYINISSINDVRSTLTENTIAELDLNSTSSKNDTRYIYGKHYFSVCDFEDSTVYNICTQVKQPKFQIIDDLKLHLAESIDICDKTPHVPIPQPISCSVKGQLHANAVLSAAQKQLFAETGYLSLSNVIPSHLVDDFVYKINHSLGVPGAIVNSNGFQTHDVQLGKLGGNLCNCQEIRRLFDPYYQSNTTKSVLKSSAGAPMGQLQLILSDLMGAGNVPSVQSLGAQLAIRFPESRLGFERDEYADVELDKYEWHVDGLRQGSRHAFSLLVGICCSEVSHSHSGNMVLWPYSHHYIHRCYKNDYGGLDIPKLSALVEHWDHPLLNFGSSHSAVSECEFFGDEERHSEKSRCSSSDNIHGMQECRGNDKEKGIVHVNIPDDLPDLNPKRLSARNPIYMKCDPGDVLILHPDTAHVGCRNIHPSGKIRIMVYFRIKSNGYLEKAGGPVSWDEIVDIHRTNPFYDLPGLLPNV